MQLKKIAIVFLVVVMMFSMAAVFTAAQGADAEFSFSAKLESENALSADPFAVKPGDVIELVVSVDSNPGDLRGVEFIVKYDSKVLEPIDCIAGGVLSLGKDDIKTVDFVKDKIHVWYSTTSTDNTSAKTGKIVTLKFEVKADFDGTADTLSLPVSEFCYRVNDAINPAEPPLGVSHRGSIASNIPTIKAHNYGKPEHIDGKCVNDTIDRYTCACGDVLDVVVKEKGHTVGDLVPAVAPTTEKPGVRAHYQCSVCEKYLDTDKWTVIDIVAAKLPKMISTPADPEWTKGNKDSLTFVSDGSFDGFKQITIDGKLVEKGAYVVKADEEGNTVIVLEPALLKTLDAGDHKLSIVFADDSWDKDYSCEADFSVRSNGAIVTIIVIVAALLVIGAGVVVALKVLKKKNII